MYAGTDRQLDHLKLNSASNVDASAKEPRLLKQFFFRREQQQSADLVRNVVLIGSWIYELGLKVGVTGYEVGVTLILLI